MNIHKLYRLFLLGSFILIFSGAKPPPQEYKLTIKVSGIKKIKGNIITGMYNNNEDWLIVGKEFIKKVNQIHEVEETIIFKDLQKGKYAISLYQDEDQDDQIKKNIIGIPKEGYGFSNNVKPWFKAPSYKNAAFIVSNDTTIHIKLIF